MALSLVAEGAAVTVLPSLMANLAWQDLAALPFNDVEMKRTLGLVTRRGSLWYVAYGRKRVTRRGASLSPPAQHLVTLLTRHLAAR